MTHAVQQAISIVKARRYVGMNHNLRGFMVKEISNSSNTVDMEICHTTINASRGYSYLGLHKRKRQCPLK